jgi:hypothetical protein
MAFRRHEKHVPVYTATFGRPIPPYVREDLNHHHHIHLYKWLMETKYAEKRVVVQDVNRRIWTVVRVRGPAPTQVAKDGK